MNEQKVSERDFKLIEDSVPKAKENWLARIIFGVLLFAWLIFFSDAMTEGLKLKNIVNVSQVIINTALIYAFVFERDSIARYFTKIWLALFLSWRQFKKNERSKVETSDTKSSAENANAPSEASAEVKPEGRKQLSAGITDNSIADVPNKSAVSRFERPRMIAVIFVILLGIILYILFWPKDRGGPNPAEIPPDIPGEEHEPEVPPEDESPIPQSRQIEIRSGEMCWNVAVRCTGDGKDWLKMVEFDPTLYVTDEICYIRADRETLPVPGDWDCK